MTQPVFLRLALFGALAVMAAPAQTFDTLINFDGANGSFPVGQLAQSLDGSLYGTTFSGGSDPNALFGGSIYQVTTGGTLSTLYNFCTGIANCPHGYGPTQLIAVANGGFYGLTNYGGAGSNCAGIYTCGTIFKIAADGQLNTMHTFCVQDTSCPDGHFANSLVLATDGNLYGTTYEGGTSCPNSTLGCGTVFKMTPSGVFTTLHYFCSQLANGICSDGAYPVGLMQGADGNFYGATQMGGNNIGPLGFGGGTVFKITATGTMTVLHSFCAQTDKNVCTDGLYPLAGVMQAANGFLYGTTSGATSAGTIFRMTMAGDFVKLHTFCVVSGCPDGWQPQTGLIQGSDGNFYGMSYGGGTTGHGTAYQMTPSGTVTTLYTFCSQPGCADGENPYGPLFQATNGTFYGTTANGGAYQNCDASGGACGTLFSISLGLGPLVQTLPSFGRVGAVITILGTNLTGATSVAFNGVPASFTVVSATEIRATVPSGAVPGSVQVATPGGLLTSNTRFRIVR